MSNSQAVKVHVGRAAQAIRATWNESRVLKSRFVLTGKGEDPEAENLEVKARWCIKGFLNPDLLELHRQSPTISADAISIIIQIIASENWQLQIADVEGAFLKGKELKRPRGTLYVELPPRGIDSVPPGAVIELVKGV